MQRLEGCRAFQKNEQLKNGRVCCIRCAADAVFFEAARENRGTVSKRGGEHSMESGGNPPGKEVIQLGITNSNKVINVDRIDCSSSLRVTLALTAAPDIISNPTDIVLVLDRSGSMAGTPLANMKTGAKTFIGIIEEATGGTQDGQIGSGSRIGIVSFADTAIANTQLITSVDTLKNAVNALTAGGSTNHADAFTKAMQMFDPASGNAKVIVMFTDGNTTTGAPPEPVAAAARAQGIIIYCIGLVGADGVDVNTLNEWASDPDASHVAVTPDAAELERLFANLAANISKPGATNIMIHETVYPDFVITNILPPTKGTATLLDSHSLRWTIPELGTVSSESALLEFDLRHVSQMGGTKLINESITYSDTEGNIVSFPAPTVAGGVPAAGGVVGRWLRRRCDNGYGRRLPRVSGQDHSDGCDHQKCVSGQAGCAGGNPYRSR